jgi:hypothetical protein
MVALRRRAVASCLQQLRTILPLAGFDLDKPRVGGFANSTYVFCHGSTLGLKTQAAAALLVRADAKLWNKGLGHGNL